MVSTTEQATDVDRHYSGIQTFLPNTMYRRWMKRRLFVMTTLVFLSSLSILYNPSPHLLPHTTRGTQHLQPWDITTLVHITTNLRNDFASLYKDNRRFFGDGNDHQEPLNKDTKPFKFPGLENEGKIVNFTKVSAMLYEYLQKYDSLLVVGNIKKLLIAASRIREQPEVNSVTYRAVFRVRKKQLHKVPKIRTYGGHFNMTMAERSVLGRVRPGVVAAGVKQNELIDLVSLNATLLNPFFMGISKYQMYPEGDIINNLLHDLGHLKIQQVYLKSLPIIKPYITFSGGLKARLIPYGASRTQETLPNQLPQDDDERHTSDIAAFHLDRILGFRRAIPSSGRIISMKNDLRTVDTEYSKSHIHMYHRSDEGNYCLRPRCGAECFHAMLIMCGNPDKLEVSMMLDMSVLNLTTWPYPWRRSFKINPWHQTMASNSKQPWETDPSFCATLRTTPPYNQGRRLLDIVDLALFDFLQGNMVRTVYDTISQFGNDTFILHKQNSRGFGKAYHDELSILAPLYQCCTLRASTYHTLLHLGTGPHPLSHLMWGSMARDPISPVLLDQHLLALDRRVRIILKMVYECISLNGDSNVVIADGL